MERDYVPQRPVGRPGGADVRRVSRRTCSESGDTGRTSDGFADTRVQ